MKLIVISHWEYLENEAEHINRLFSLKMPLLHLRKPDGDKRKFQALIKKIKPDYHRKIVIHQHYELAKTYELVGIHLTESFMKGKRSQTLDNYLRDWKVEGFSVSTSIHHQNSLFTLSPEFDYAFAGPVFESISKPGYGPAENWNLINIKDQIRTQVFALGGIKATNIGQTKAMGFDGVAVLGALWNQAGCVDAVFENIQKSCQQFVPSY